MPVPTTDPDTAAFLPEGRVVVLPGRGETFVRVGAPPRPEDGPAPAAPTVLLLHGWLATADLNWFALYGPLSRRAHVIAMDHRGHGRGLRTPRPFTLEAAADDAAAVLDVLRTGPVIVCGYSMGGSIAMLLAHRRPDLVSGLVLCATALEWNAQRADRLRWRAVGAVGAALRLGLDQRATARIVDDMAAGDEVVAAYREHLLGEAKRLDAADALAAARSLARFDVRPIAPQLGLPTAVVATRRDRLVQPRRQLALAAATGALRFDLEADHLAFLRQPRDWASSVGAAIESVAVRLAPTAFVPSTATATLPGGRAGPGEAAWPPPEPASRNGGGRVAPPPAGSRTG